MSLFVIDCCNHVWFLLGAFAVCVCLCLVLNLLGLCCLDLHQFVDAQRFFSSHLSQLARDGQTDGLEVATGT